MNGSLDESQKEILEVERRLVSRVERVGRNWQELRSTAKRKYALPALVAAAAVGALAVGAAAARGKRRAPDFHFRRGEEKTTLMAKLIAVTSLISTLRRVPIAPLLGPALEWMRSRRSGADTNRRASPISARRLPPLI